MGVENTIAKLKAYFDTWHNKADHTAVQDFFTNSTSNQWILNVKDKVDALLQGYNSEVTIEQLKNNNQTNSNNINNINNSINNINNKISHFNDGVIHYVDGYNELATYDSQCVHGYTKDNFMKYGNNNYGIAIVYISDVFTFTKAKKNTWIKTGERIKTKYRPTRGVHFTSKTPYTIGKIDANGYIWGKSIIDGTEYNIELYGTATYLYKL